ncbi:helix-turn-helix transcriptional regulator [Akkermansiaceae bacterium]|nr:helix-turn-helix transcriptional regulator [Akkermansiaceae bacterium]
MGGTLYPVKNSDGSLHEVTVVHHDVTDLKAAEELIRRLLRSDPSCPSQENLAHQALTHIQGYKPVRALPDFSDPKPLINLGLTRKEAEVLLWVAQGKSNSEAAIILNITVSTVKKHMEHVFEKLSVEKRGAASLIAIEAITDQTTP